MVCGFRSLPDPITDKHARVTCQILSADQRTQRDSSNLRAVASSHAGAERAGAAVDNDATFVSDELSLHYIYELSAHQLHSLRNSTGLSDRAGTSIDPIFTVAAVRR